MNFDSAGFIGQIQSDGSVEGGDSLCWNGHWLYLTKEAQIAIPIVRMPMHRYKVSFGAYVRHPIPEFTNNGFGAYYKSPWDGCISRDQFTGLLVGLIAENNKLAMLEVILHWSLRLFLFSYNTKTNGRDPDTTHYKMPDFTGPDIWATALRGFGIFSWFFWPLLCVLDLHTLINTIIHNHKKESDAINFTGKLLVAKDYCPTPTSLLAWWVCDKKELLKELEEYWCGWRDSQEFYLLYENKLKGWSK